MRGPEPLIAQAKFLAAAHAGEFLLNLPADVLGHFIVPGAFWVQLGRKELPQHVVKVEFRTWKQAVAIVCVVANRQTDVVLVGQAGYLSQPG